MKKSILVLAAFTFMTGSVLTSCNSSPAEKVETAQADVVDANKELAKAKEGYLTDIETYKKETADRIAANEASIAQFNKQIANEKKAAKADYKKKIAKLEKKNSEMKMKLNEYKADGKEKWDTFKTEFNHDMDDLGKSLKDFTVKNVK